MAIAPAGWLLLSFGSGSGTPTPTPPEGDDPFTLVYKALWNLALSNPNFTQKVAAQNRIAFIPTDTYNYAKSFLPNKLHDDYPEVILTVENSTSNLTATSNTASIRRTYAFLIGTDKPDLNPDLFPVEWELLRSLSNWRESLTALRWEDKQFVHNCRVQSGTTLWQSAPASSNNTLVIRGWVSVWRAEIEMNFDKADLRI